MKFGLSGHFLAGCGRGQLLEWMRRADAGPYDTFATGERILFDHLDPLIYLAAAAAVTERVSIMTNVIIVPLRAPVLLAKQLASLDVLSAGRLVVGVGTGYRTEDFYAVGAETSDRWQRLEESVDVMRHVWRGLAPTSRVEGHVGPRPVRQGGPPILSSASTPRSVAQAARWADGWQGAVLDAEPQVLRQHANAQRAAWASAGRNTAPYLMNTVSLIDPSAAGDTDHHTSVSGFPVSAVGALAEGCDTAGIDELLFAPLHDDLRLLDELDDAVSRLR